MTSRSLAVTRAHIADALTASRFVLAVAVIPLIASGAWLAACITVSAAWWSDFLDGRVARSTTGSRLGELDPYADTAVGIGIVVGMVGGGHLPGPVWWLVVTSVLAIAYLATGVFALSESIQAVGYGPLLWLAAIHHRGAFTVLVATILAIWVLDFQRFRTHALPTFFTGIRTLPELVSKRFRRR